MEPLLYVLAIRGCGDAGNACTQARVMPATYRNEASCIAAQTDALMANSDLDFPVIVAECRRSGLLMADASPADRGSKGL